MRFEFLFTLPVTTTIASIALAQRPFTRSASAYEASTDLTASKEDSLTTWNGRTLTKWDGTPFTSKDGTPITLSPTATYTPLNDNDTPPTTDDSASSRNIGFYPCECRETVSMEGDERIFEHSCEFEGTNFDDEPNILHTAIGMNLKGLDYVHWPGSVPEMEYLVPPKARFIDRFQYQVTSAPVQVGTHMLSYLVRDFNHTSQTPCYLLHTQLPKDAPTFTSYFWVMSDFMGGMTGPYNLESPNAYMTKLLKYMFSFQIPAWPLYVSAGNYIGGDPWDVNPINHKSPFMMKQLSQFRIANVGTLELPYGKAYLDKVGSNSGISNYISSNIYSKSTGQRVFRQYRRWSIDAPSDTKKVEVAFFGMMTEQSKRLIPTADLALYDIRTDLEVELMSMNHDCFVLKNQTYGLKCVLLVSGGFSPNYAHNPALEIEANETEFATIVNSLLDFDGFVGSQTMVGGSIILPNERWVTQGQPRAQLMSRIGLTRPKQQDSYTAPTLGLSPIDGSQDIPEDPAEWPQDIEGAWAALYDDELEEAEKIVPVEEIGIYQGSIPLFNDPANPFTWYTQESPIATSIADAIRSTSNADIAIVEGNIAAHGLMATRNGDDDEEKETILTNRHIRELLIRNSSRTAVLNVTPSQLFAALNEQWQPETSTTHLFRSLAFSNLKAGFDAKRPTDAKVAYIEVNGQRIDENDHTTVFTLITSDYLRGGAIGHTVIRDLPAYSDQSESDEGEDEGSEAKAVAEVDGGVLSGVEKLAKSNLRAVMKAAVPAKESRLADFDGVFIRDLFIDHVTNHPVAAPSTRTENSTVIVSRDTAIHVSFPVKTPDSSETPFPVQLHFTTTGDKTLEGPFNLYRRDTAENLGQIAEISKEDPAVLQFDTYLTPLSQLVTLYVTDSRWEDQSYQRELAFAISLPGLSNGEDSSSDDDSSTTTAATVARTAGAALNFVLGSSFCIALMMNMII